ncbi:MAG: hypothetical protein ATN35_07525 [Epulopiscium sp. Nele67-Bin004]|nr:MAG: hypothetical protein ATN35_07525 [Epulopiscium sp. Nele67-Bin004]
MHKIAGGKRKGGRKKGEGRPVTARTGANIVGAIIGRPNAGAKREGRPMPVQGANIVGAIAPFFLCPDNITAIYTMSCLTTCQSNLNDSYSNSYNCCLII